MKKTALKILINIYSIVIIIILWELGAKFNLFKTVYFPPPSQVINRLFYLLSNNNTGFLNDIVASSSRFFIAAVISIPSAICLAFLISLNKQIASFFNPLIALSYPIPKLAILPLLLLLFGIDDTSKILIIAAGIFYLVLINTSLGIGRIISSDYLDIVRIYKIPWKNKILKIFLRGALPEILTGIKLGLGYGLVMVVGSEFTISKNGVGFFMWNAWDQFRPIDLYCGLYVLSISGIIVFFVLDKITSNLNEMKN